MCVAIISFRFVSFSKSKHRRRPVQRTLLWTTVLLPAAAAIDPIEFSVCNFVCRWSVSVDVCALVWYDVLLHCLNLKFSCNAIDDLDI